jgi:hypothetical protein
MTQGIERRSREEYLRILGRPAFVSPRMSPELEAKQRRILAIAKNREGLRKVKLAAARIEAELEHRLELSRRAGGADEGYLLTEIKRLRADLDCVKV